MTTYFFTHLYSILVYILSRMNKFGAKRTSLDGYSFQSKLEASVYAILKQREIAGELMLIQVQDHICICGEPDHDCERPIQYIADFKCLDIKSGEFFHVEAKGMETDVWRLKRNLWKHYGPGKLEVWKGSHLKPYLHEVLRGA